MPTLLVYYSEGGLTSIVLPGGLGSWLGSWGWTGPQVIHLGELDIVPLQELLKQDLGPIYYIYLILLPTFTTNSFNILAGINGVEAIQAFIIALSVGCNDLLFLPIWPRSFLIALGGIGNPHEGRILAWAAGEVVKRHLMSFYFMAPLVGVCGGFLWHNWSVVTLSCDDHLIVRSRYPAKAFPGDTFCYFTGMAFSAVAIQGHFSKTLILFFIPQIFNFILSCPQLFGLVDCPRHRLPKYVRCWSLTARLMTARLDERTGLLGPSLTMFEKAPLARTKLTLEILETLQLVELGRINPIQLASQGVTSKSNEVSNGTERRPRGQIISSTNLTLLNFLLIRVGPLHERTLCLLVGGIQVACSVLAFGIRYGVGAWVYGGERR